MRLLLCRSPSSCGSTLSRSRNDTRMIAQPERQERPSRQPCQHVEHGAPDHVDHRQDVGGRAQPDRIEDPRPEDPVAQHHPREVDDRREGQRQDAHADRLTAVAAAVAHRVEEADQQDDERRSETRPGEHRERLEFRRDASDVQAQCDRRHGRPRQHDVGTEPTGTERRERIAEERAVGERRRERLGALLHELDREDEQEERHQEGDDLDRDPEPVSNLRPARPPRSFLSRRRRHPSRPGPSRVRGGRRAHSRSRARVGRLGCRGVPRP